MSAWIWVLAAIFVLAAGASLSAVMLAARGKSRGAMSTSGSQRRLRRLRRRPEPREDAGERDEERSGP